jgi:hypothetical protein
MMDTAAEHLTRPVVSGRDSQPDGSLVASMLAEQKSAEWTCGFLRFVRSATDDRRRSGVCSVSISGALVIIDRGSAWNCSGRAARRSLAASCN